MQWKEAASEANMLSQAQSSGETDMQSSESTKEENS